MRVAATTGCLVLGAVLISTISLTTTPAKASQAEVTCPCDCPPGHKILPRHAAAHPAGRIVRRHAEGGVHYNYSAAAAASVYRVAQVAHYAPPAYVEPEGLVIDQYGWTGGVGYGDEGGGGGYGQVLLAGANSQNGPSYNSFGESFQENPSVPHPFQNRLMGGLAPTRSGSSSGSK